MLGTLGLELQVLVNTLTWVLGTEYGSSLKAELYLQPFLYLSSKREETGSGRLNHVFRVAGPANGRAEVEAGFFWPKVLPTFYFFPASKKQLSLSRCWGWSGEQNPWPQTVREGTGPCCGGRRCSSGKGCALVPPRTPLSLELVSILDFPVGTEGSRFCFSSRQSVLVTVPLL